MRTKLLSALLLASTALAGVASASPIVRDHRYQQPTVTVSHPQPQRQPQRHDGDRDHDRDRDRDRDQWSGGVKVTARPSWIPNTTYGFQVSATGNSYTPYNYGQDPYVEGIARSDWSTLAENTRLAYNQDSQIDVDLSGQRLQALEIQATGGRDFIREVHVELNDGREIKLATNRLLDVTQAPNLRLDLGAQADCGVRRIEIFGYSTGKGQFRVLGA